MSVTGSWQPDSGLTLSKTAIDRFLNAAASSAEGFGLSADDAATLAPLAIRKTLWVESVTDLSDAELESLCRFFTVAEGRLPGWDAGNDSPVIALAAELRQRGAWPEPLTAWIKANTSNRFLPWGSLLDRL